MNAKVGISMGFLFSTLLLAPVIEAEDIQLGTASFRNFERIETELRRGVSTKEEVRQLLGEPNGEGAAFFPTAKNRNDSWYYEDIKGDADTTSGGGVIRIQMHWQVAIIFFDGDRYDGFMWFTSAEEAKGETSQ